MLETAELGKGPQLLREIAWGSHFCQFFRTSDDLLDILVPYFAEGLSLNQGGMWVVSDPLTEKLAVDALAARVPDLASRMDNGQFEVRHYSEWYKVNGRLDLGGALDGWNSRLEEARRRGFDGLRVTGNVTFLGPGEWDEFVEYEHKIDKAMAGRRMIAICTYPLDGCHADRVVDVVRNHRFAIIKRGGQWEVLESAERRQAEVLRQSEQLYRSLVSSTGAWIVRLDREGRRTLTIGGEPGALEASRKSIQDIVAPEDKDTVIRTLESVFTTRTPAQGVGLKVRSNGTFRHVTTNWEPVENGDAVVREVQVTAIDVTDQVRLQEEFHRSQKIESVGRLAGGVAHDLNNILAVIDGYSDAVLGTTPVGTAERGYLEEVKAAVGRAAALTRQLLTFSRGQPMQAKVIDVRGLLTNLGNMLRRVIREDIQLSINIQPECWPVKADPGQIEQVLVNMAINARDAMPGGGKLIIDVANATLPDAGVEKADVSVGAERGDISEFVRISITDTGFGMTDEVKAHLFEPFYTTKPKGTGLGLATSFGIIKQSGGHMTVQSAAHAGTTIRIYLPRVLGDVEPASEPDTSDPTAGQGETILLVEDEDGLRKLLGMSLRQLGYAVLEASSGVDAWRLAQQHGSRIDLLLTDLVMPEMSGRDLAALFRASGFDLKVIYMSGYASSRLADSIPVEPGSFFLEKPFRREALSKQLRLALGKGD